MIKLIGLDKKEFILNDELIEKIETVPESLLTLSNGKKYLVKDSVADILNKIIEYKRKISILALQEE